MKHLSMTQRIELSLILLQFLNLEKFKELIFPTPRIELLLKNMTQRFLRYDFFSKIQIIEPFST